MAFDHLRDRRKIEERWGTNAPPHRFGSSVGNHVVALLAAWTFNRDVSLANGRTRAFHHVLEVVDHGFHSTRRLGLGRENHARIVDVDRSVRKTVERLPHDARGLAHLLDANEIAIVHVTVDTDRHIEIVGLVVEIWKVLAHVVRDAGCAYHRPGQSPVDRLFRAHHTEPDRAADPDAVVRQKLLDVIQHLVESGKKASGIVGPAVRNVRHQAADARERRRETRTGPRFEQLIDQLTLMERPEERCVRADIDRRGTEPHEMRHDARQLARDHAKHLAALGYRDAEQPLRTERHCNVVARRIEVVLAIGPRDYLIVLTILAGFLEAAVQVADVWNAAYDGLAVQLEHQPEHTVGRRMLWTQVDEHVLTVERGLERERLGDSNRYAAVVCHERNALWLARSIEAACRELDFYCSCLGRHGSYSPVLSPDASRRRMSSGISLNASATVSSSIE